MKRFSIISSIVAAAFVMAGCSEVNPTYTPPVQEGEVEVSTGFALGADISWVTQMESEGETFSNADGQEMECTALMKEIGMNAIRLRVWVNPEDGWCGTSDVVAKALRAQKLGMRIMIDFHYSDTWADPARQLIPAAWLEYNTQQLTDAVSNHTTEVLTALKNAGVDVAWVQVGNEITHGMLHHTEVDEDNNGSTMSEYGGNLDSQPANLAAFISAGYDAVKAVYPEAEVVVHVDRGHDIYYPNAVFSVLKTYSAKYDIMGLSLYPSSAGMDSVNTCLENIKTLNTSYNKRVMIVEFGMPNDDADTAYSCYSALISGAKSSGICDGVFYWEPEAPDGYNNGYGMGAFENGRPTHALDAVTEAAAAE